MKSSERINWLVDRDVFNGSVGHALMSIVMFTVLASC